MFSWGGASHPFTYAMRESSDHSRCRERHSVSGERMDGLGGAVVLVDWVGLLVRALGTIKARRSINGSAYC